MKRKIELPYIVCIFIFTTIYTARVSAKTENRDKNDRTTRNQLFVDKVKQKNTNSTQPDISASMTNDYDVSDLHYALKHVFSNNDTDKAIYHDDMMPGFVTKSDGKPRTEKSKKNYYKTYWRTHQMSDHLPMWVELKIDYTNDYLQRRLDE